jgi:CRP-like cAMP-binding protein
MHAELTEKLSASKILKNLTNNLDWEDEVISLGLREIILKAKIEQTHPFLEVLRIGSGGFFGEIALINHTLRKASIQCTQDSFFLTLQKEDFNNVLL